MLIQFTRSGVSDNIVSVNCALVEGNPEYIGIRSVLVRKYAWEAFSSNTHIQLTYIFELHFSVLIDSPYLPT